MLMSLFKNTKQMYTATVTGWEKPRSPVTLSLWYWTLSREGHAPCQTPSPEQQQHRLGKGLEIVVPIDLVVISHGNFPKHLRGEIIRGGGKQKNGFCHTKTNSSVCKSRTDSSSTHTHWGTSLVPKDVLGPVSTGIMVKSGTSPCGRKRCERQAALLMEPGMTSRTGEHGTGSCIGGSGLGSQRPPGQ